MKFIKKKEGNTKTKICPDCGSKYLVNTGYCVKCKKKVKEEDIKVEKIGGFPFPNNLHADEGEALTELTPDEYDNYDENPQFLDKYQQNKIQQQADENKFSKDQDVSKKVKTEIKSIDEFMIELKEFLKQNKA